jgi:hypothetical protein
MRAASHGTPFLTRHREVGAKLSVIRAVARIVQPAIAAAIVAASVPYAFLMMFSQFQIYDDEGFIMSSVKTFLGGQALYDRTFTQYGPFYYLVASLAYSVLGIPVGHDSTRMATIVMWIGASALLAVFVYAVTRSFALGAFGYLQAVLHCTGLIGEPGHPQSLLLVLVGTLLLAASVMRPARVSVMLGVVTGCIFMTKINVGVFTAGACVMALLAVAGGHRTLRVLAGTGFSLLPFVLMRTALAGPTLIYAVTAASAIAACGIATSRTPHSRDGSLRPRVYFAAAATAIAAAVAIGILLLGTSLGGLVEGILVSPLRLASIYGQEWALPAKAAWRGAASVAAATAFVLVPSGTLRLRLAIALKLAFALLMLRASMYGSIAMAAMAPFVWVVALPVEAEHSGGAPLVRVLAAFIAASQLLIAYPVAGNQQALATLWLIPAALIALADAATALWRVRGAWIPQLADAVLVGSVLVWFWPSYQTAQLAEQYRVFASLDLPHADRIRLPRVQKRTYHALVNAIHANCDTFVTMPGFNSLYFWTQMAPPTGYNAGTWMTLFDAPTQQRVVDAIASHPSACVVYHDGLMRAWVGTHDVEGRPLVKYIRSSFHAVQTIGDYQFMIRNERGLPQ